MGNNKGKTHIQELNGEENPANMANIMNNLFTDIGPNLANDMPDSLLDINYDFNDEYEQLELEPTTPVEIKKIMINISNKKSTAIDGVLIRFLKMTIDTTSVILCFIINLSIATRTVPIGWTTCVLTPLYKDGDRTDPSNHRPIAILPTASKFLECTLHR